jgi:hypothetical protein
VLFSASFKEEQSVLTDRYTVLQEAEKFDRSLMDQH